MHSKQSIPVSMMTIFTLQGCVSNDDYKASANPIYENSTVSHIISGRLYSDVAISGANVCFDSNKNGLCDDDEDSVITDTQGYFEFNESVSQKHSDEIVLAHMDTYILNANQNAVNTNITPYTTLVVNEQLFNPYVNVTKSQSINYLTEHLSDVNEVSLSGTITEGDPNAGAIVNSLKSGFSIGGSGNLETVAGVVDAMITSDSLTVSPTSLPSQTRVDSSFEVSDLNKTTEWEIGYNSSKDGEVVMGGTTSDSRFVSFSKWNNRLTLLDINGTDATRLDTENFLCIDTLGGREAVDSETGASEQILSKVEIANDNTTYYSALTKLDEESTQAGGVGIYKTTIHDTIPELLQGRVTTGSNFFAMDDLVDIDLSSDDTLLVAASKDMISLFDPDDLSHITGSFQIASGQIHSIHISDDNHYIFAGIEDNVNRVAIFAPSGTALGSFELSKAPDILVSNTTSLYVASTVEKKAYKLNISDTDNIRLGTTFNPKQYITSLSVSENGEYLIAGTAGKRVTIYSSSNSEISARINVNANVAYAYDINNTNIGILYGIKSGGYEGVYLSYYGYANEEKIFTEEEKLIWENTHRK